LAGAGLPVFPAIISGVRSFTAASFYVLLLQLPVSALVCWPLFYVALRIGNPTTAAVAGWLWAVFPAESLYPSNGYGLLVFRTAGDQSALERLPPDHDPRRYFILYGLFWGSACCESGVWSVFLSASGLFRVVSSKLHRAADIALVFLWRFLFACLDHPQRRFNSTASSRSLDLHSNCGWKHPIYDNTPGSRIASRVTKGASVCPVG